MTNRLPLIAALLLLIIVGGVLRAWPVASSPLWFDEADTWRSGIIDPHTSGWNERTGLYEPVAMEYGKFFRWQNHFETAPLTFLLARISTEVTHSTAEWAMRLPSLIAGILCIPAAFWLGWVVRGSALGLLLAALVTFDPSQVDQSQQCRMYTVMILLLLLAVALTIKLVREPEPGLKPGGEGTRSLNPVWQWVTLGALYGLLLWATQFTVAVWVGVALGVGALLALGAVTGKPHPKAKKVIIGMTSAFAVGVMLANVGIHHILHRALSGEIGDRPHLTYGQMFREIVVAAKDLIDLTPAGLIVYVFVAIGLGLLFRVCKTSTAVVAGIALMNVAILFRFLRVHHFMDPRYLFCILPAVWVGLGMFALGFKNVMMKRAALALVILFIAVQAWQSTHLLNYYQQPDRYLFAQEIVRVRDQIKADETASIFPGVGVILGQYYRLPQDPKLFAGLYHPMDHYPLDKQEVPRDLRAKGTWVIMGMYNHETAEGKQRTMRLNTLKLIAAHYGTTVDERALDKHLQQNRILTAHISADGVKVESRGLE